MKWGSLGTIGGLFLAAYLILAGLRILTGIAIPLWFDAILALAAGALIVVGR